MKLFYVVRVDVPGEREQFILHQRREFIISFDEDQPRSEGLSSNTSVFGVNTEQDANLLLGWLTTRYPANSYMIVKSLKAGYREPGELKFGVYTEEGFMPA